MNILGLFTKLLATIATVGIAAWFLGKYFVRLGVRRCERTRILRSGPLLHAGLYLLVPVVFVAAVTAYLACEAFIALAPDAPAEKDAPFLHAAWPWVLPGGCALLILTSTVAAFRQGWLEWGSLLRRRQLTEPQPAASPAAAMPPSPHSGRRIVICCDGTSNRPDQEEDGQSAITNVCKLSRSLVSDEEQTVWYQPGIGSDTSSTAQEAQRTKRILELVGAKTGSEVAAIWGRLVKAFEGAFGAGISEGIANGYAEIVRQYRPGDRIYLVGFSRGAYTARCIAGVIYRCGLLRAENLRYAPEVVRLYRTRRAPNDEVALARSMIHSDVSIEFVGVFDTVASLGVPLWGWWFRALPVWRNKALATDPAAVCRHVYHALSMDERRSQFFPALFTRPEKDSKLETLEQRWFRGAHGDIGGGYARAGLSDIALGWMMDKMSRHGLVFQPNARAALKPDPLAPLHDELSRKPFWRRFGSWPRWHPTPGPDEAGQDTRLHRSVLRRAAVSHRRLNRCDLRRLAAGQSIEIVVEAKRDWDRTGIVIERGATYSLTWQDGEWRDGERALCGPTGQPRRGLFGWSRRLSREPWLRLTATVAHPRLWELHERGLWLLLRLLFMNDPVELRQQLAPLGRDLPTPGATVFIRSDAPSGLLHLFANDHWHAAGDNSGGIRLQITRVRQTRPGQITKPCWRLKDDGIWEAPQPA